MTTTGPTEDFVLLLQRNVIETALGSSLPTDVQTLSELYDYVFCSSDESTVSAALAGALNDVDSHPMRRLLLAQFILARPRNSESQQAYASLDVASQFVLDLVRMAKTMLIRVDSIAQIMNVLRFAEPKRNRPWIWYVVSESRTHFGPASSMMKACKLADDLLEDAFGS